MAGKIDAAQFSSMLAEKYPAIASDMEKFWRGIVHLEMGTFARATQAAMGADDEATVREHFRFIGAIYRQATEVKNAVHVSYLEQIGFDGRHGKRMKAREMLSPPLQAALRGLEAYLEE